MRPNQNKRMRGRNNNNRRGPNPLTRAYESNGPDVKVRGTAATVAEKYVQLARDAHVAGDPVAAENYLQHAEHYYRIIATAQALQTAQQQQLAGVPVTVEIDDADEDDFDNALSDRFTFRTPQSFQPNDPSNPNNPQPPVPPMPQQREGGEPRRFEPRDRQDFRRDENRNDARGENRNDRGDYRRNERPPYAGEQPSYEPDQAAAGEPREGVNPEGGDRQPRNNDRFGRRDRFRGRDRQDGRPDARPDNNRPENARPDNRSDNRQDRAPREGGERFERNDRQDRGDRPERFDRPSQDASPAPDSDIGLPSFITQPKRVIVDAPADAPLADMSDVAVDAAPRKRAPRKPKVVAADSASEE